MLPEVEVDQPSSCLLSAHRLNTTNRIKNQLLCTTRLGKSRLLLRDQEVTCWADTDQCTQQRDGCHGALSCRGWHRGVKLPHIFVLHPFPQAILVVLSSSLQCHHYTVMPSSSRCHRYAIVVAPSSFHRRHVWHPYVHATQV